MERNRLTRSKSAAIIEGNAQNTKYRSLSKQSSDSYLFTDGFTNGNEVGMNSYNGAGGKPIKKLLAEEMTKECEPKKRSPSLIARLMGLEGFPSPQHGHKQQKTVSNKRNQLNASIGSHQTSRPVEDLSSRRVSVDKLEFKDVYEDLEASNMSNRCYSSARVSDSRLQKSTLEQVHLKNKQFLSSERVSASKEFDNSFELPDSVFIEQFHDNNSPSNSLHELTNFVENEDNAKVWEHERANECRGDASSRRKREDGLLLLRHNNRHKSCKSCHPPENRFNAKIEKDMLPTKIVLLKPNLGMTSNSNALVPSPSSSHTHSSSFKKHLESKRAKAAEAQKKTLRNLSNSSSFSKARCGKDRELARAITRHVRESLGPFGHDLIFSAPSGVKGYAGDESSSDVYESDSSSSMERMNISSSNSSDGSIRFKSSPSNCTEAKKHLSERWKTSQRCQDSQPIEKVSTLGEMLAVSNRSARREHLDAVAIKVCSTEASYGNSSNHRDGPPGIRNSSRSKSLPRYDRNEPHINDLITCDKRNGGRSKSRKGNIGRNEDNTLISIKTNSRNPYISCRKFDEGFDRVFDEIKSDISLIKHGEGEKLVLRSVEPDINVQDATLSFANMCCNQPENILKDHNSRANDQDTRQKEPLVCQSDEGSVSLLCTEPEPEPEPECSENSKEAADHDSPVSVLGVSFSEDQLSSSDCFATVNSELNELRMQLQLLKMESGNYNEEPPTLSLNDDDFMQSVYNEECDNWKFNYIDDVLINSGLEAIDQDAFLAAWHSRDCVLDPRIYNIVEKYWNDDLTVMTKLDRKLLFDGMNSALLEAFHELVDPRPWVVVGSVSVGFNSKWRSECVRDVLKKYIVELEERCSRERKEKELDREMNWLKIEDGIEIIGKEIEELLVDELLGEVILAF